MRKNGIAVIYMVKRGGTLMLIRRRLGGLILMSMGVGMLLVLLLPGWGFILATGMVVGGFYIMFF